MENTGEKLKYNRAEIRMKELKSYYIMLGGFVLLVPFLIFTNMKINPEFQWFWFPVIGGAISIIYYTFYLFVGRNWEARKIQKLLDKEK